jgi:antitoxin VapB
MNIKDPAVHEAAQQLARLRGVSMTEAIRQAVGEALAREHGDAEARITRMRQLGREARDRMDALGTRPLTDDEIYDEIGAPR